MHHITDCINIFQPYPMNYSTDNFTTFLDIPTQLRYPGEAKSQRYTWKTTQKYTDLHLKYHATPCLPYWDHGTSVYNNWYLWWHYNLACIYFLNYSMNCTGLFSNIYFKFYTLQTSQMHEDVIGRDLTKRSFCTHFKEYEMR